MATTDKINGVIKTLKREEGFGFITDRATGQDYFFHRTGLERTSKAWIERAVDDAVRFTPIEGPKGLRAIEVQVTE